MELLEKSPATRRAGAGDEDTLLGARLRERRKQQGMKLKDLADAVGLSVGLLSQIERGLSSPSMRSLRQLCQALQVDGASLFDPPAPETPHASRPSHGAGHTESPRAAHFVVRLADRRPLRLGGVTKYRVTPADCSSLEAFILEIEPGAASDSNFAWQNGDKIAHVQSGRLTLYVDDVVLMLAEGDVYGFSSGHRYRWENPGSAPSRLLVVNSSHFYV